ncbi:hypothetical protein HN51_001712 [Arachis hypogaea]
MAVEESEPMIPELEREENLIAAARHIGKALGSNKNLTTDAKKILVDLGSKLSSMSISREMEEGKKGEEDEEEEEEEEKGGVNATEDRINVIQEKIMRWEEDQSMIWDLGPEEASEYLNAANKACRLIEKLESFNLSKDDQEYKLLIMLCLGLGDDLCFEVHP